MSIFFFENQSFFLIFLTERGRYGTMRRQKRREDGALSIVLGIDVGGSTTKICGFDENKKMIAHLSVKADDPVSSIYGAFGKFTSQCGLSIPDVRRVMITGVGSSFVEDDLFGVPTCHVQEFDCIGRGGNYLAGLPEAIVVSIGTGTAIVHTEGDKCEYLGGTGVGGGTMHGLAQALVGVTSVRHLDGLARKGDLSKVDLRIGDISNKNLSPTLMPETTAANFGNLSDLAEKEDLALGIENLVFESVGMLSVFAARVFSCKNVVLTGNLSTLDHAKEVFRRLGEMFSLNFLFPENRSFATVIGAALLSFEEKK